MSKTAREQKCDVIHDQLFKCCVLLQEQFDYLLHLSVDDLQTNLVLYQKIKTLNEHLRVYTYTALKGIKTIMAD